MPAELVHNPTTKCTPLIAMSTAKLNGGAADAAIAAAQLERRLAKSTVFADANPHLRIVPTTSNPGELPRQGGGAGSEPPHAWCLASGASAGQTAAHPL